MRRGGPLGLGYFKGIGGRLSNGHERRVSRVPDQRVRVYLDALGGGPRSEFDAWTTGADWNGWATPLFDLNEGIRVVAAFNSAPGYLASHPPANYDTVRDEFVFPASRDGEDEEERYAPISVGGRKLYPIGTYYWTWSEV